MTTAILVIMFGLISVLVVFLHDKDEKKSDSLIAWKGIKKTARQLGNTTARQQPLASNNQGDRVRANQPEIDTPQAHSHAFSGRRPISAGRPIFCSQRCRSPISDGRDHWGPRKISGQKAGNDNPTPLPRYGR